MIFNVSMNNMCKAFNATYVKDITFLLIITIILIGSLRLFLPLGNRVYDSMLAYCISASVVSNRLICSDINSLTSSY